MSNVKKPNPIVEFRVCSMGIEHEVIFTDETTHLDGGHYTAIETGQAEAYKDACVREALEQAAGICDRFADRGMHPAECAGAIRALIPKQ